MRRFEFLRKAVNRPIPKGFLVAWTLVGIYDTAVSQLLPDELSKESPRAWHLIAASAEYLPGWPYWVWFVILVVMLAVFCIEYAYRVTASAQKNADLRPIEMPKPATLRATYALPKEAEQTNIERLSNQELGALMSVLATDINKIFAPRIGYLSDAEAVSMFMARYATRFFWLYGEAKRRGHVEPVLDHTFEQPSRVFNAGHVSDLVKRLRAFASIVKLHA